MLIPRFSLRWLLALTTFCAVFSLLLASAVRGNTLAIGGAAALSSLLILAVLHASAFTVAWLLSRLEAATFGHRRGSSPFAPETATGPQSPSTLDNQPPVMG